MNACKLSKNNVALALMLCAAVVHSCQKDAAIKIQEQAPETLLHERLEGECKQKEAQACMALGSRYTLGLEVPYASTQKAAELFERACDLGQLIGCTGLADIYAHRQIVVNRSEVEKDPHLWVAKDVAKANRIYRSACEQGESMACAHLGDNHQRGEGVEKNLIEANRLHRKACEANYMNSCSRLSENYREGFGVQKDAEKARFYGQRVFDIMNAEIVEIVDPEKQTPASGLRRYEVRTKTN